MEKRVIVHEDDDPLVVAVEGLLAKEKSMRRAGLLVFAVDYADGFLKIIRSRFDGDYGNVCRMIFCPSAEGKCQETTFAPTADVLNALVSGGAEGHAQKLRALFHEWVSKGDDE